MGELSVANIPATASTALATSPLSLERLTPPVFEDEGFRAVDFEPDLADAEEVLDLLPPAGLEAEPPVDLDLEELVLFFDADLAAVERAPLEADFAFEPEVAEDRAFDADELDLELVERDEPDFEFDEPDFEADDFDEPERDPDEDFDVPDALVERELVPDDLLVVAILNFLQIYSMSFEMHASQFANNIPLEKRVGMYLAERFSF